MRAAITLAALLASAPAYAGVIHLDAHPGVPVTHSWDGSDDVQVRFFDFDANPASYVIHLVTVGTAPNGRWDLVFESAFADPHVMAPAKTPWDWDYGWTLVQARCAR